MIYPAWQMKPADAAGEKALLAAGLGTLMARVLSARGYSTVEAVRPLLQENIPLSDPYLLKDMDKAVARIRQAIENEEPIVIFGDYDVDGVSATAILYEQLSNMGAQVRCKLPMRDAGGYGINKQVLESLAKKGYTLVVTVDNGISAVEEAAYAKELGIDLVITDHHLPPEPLPVAVAVVDPKRTDDTSPFKELCGAGVAFKLCAALDECDPMDLLDEYGELAALGTIADVMPLVGENRTIVREGLSVLQDTMRPGLQALLDNAGYSGRPVTADTVSYGLAPRLNAAGRMQNASVALKLLLCSSEEQATGIAARLAEINTERQQTEQTLYAEALAKLEADPERTHDRVIVVAEEGWHCGVIGIVASRLAERYGKPVIVISQENGEGRGSGRAPGTFNLHSALAACSSLLIRYGGHAAAAGLLIEEENIPAFRQAVNAWARKEYAVPQPPVIHPDAVVQIAELTVNNVQAFEQLAPFGRSNPVPLLVVQNAIVDGTWPIGAEGKHTRVRLRQGASSCFASIFNVAPADFPYPVGAAVDVVLETSIFNGRNGSIVSAHTKAIRPAGLGNLPSEQMALFESFSSGDSLTAAQAESFLPTRADTVAVYKQIRAGAVFCNDLQPLFALQGAENTNRTLVSLTALQQLGLIEQQGARYLPTQVAQKQDLASAPILQKLKEMSNKGSV